MNYYYINDEHLKRVGSGNNTYDLAYNARDPCVTRTVNGAITYYIYDGRSRFWSTTQTARWSVSISMGKGIDEIIERGAYGADNQGGRRVTFKHLTLALTCYAKSMARPLRVEFEGAVYHLCARGNARQPVFRDERDCARFLELLTESAQRFEAAILCFVLMGNHFHLVAQTRRPNLRRWMHWLLVSYTMYFNRRHRSSGHLFQGRYQSFWYKKAIICLA